MSVPSGIAMQDTPRSLALALVLGLLLACGCSPADANAGALQGSPYLGESPPGIVPVPFAPHVFTRELHSSPVFSPGGDEVFWNEMEGGAIHVMKVEHGRWSEPAVASFTLPESGEPEYAVDGDVLYFLSGHRVGESQGDFDENVWKVTRTAEGWSRPQLLGSPVNDHPMHWGVSLAANGNLYFGHTGGSEDLFVAEYRDGVYQEPVPLGEAVNTEDLETTPEVAPDESYLLFSRVVDHGRGPIDLYVSFRGEDGSWLEAVPVLGVNTAEREISPRMSPDGEYLFFLRTVNGELMPFWVDARVIENLSVSAREPRQLTNDPAFDYHPVFSPSGEEILFTSRTGESTALFRIGVEGGEPQRVPVDLEGDLYSDWAPDGASIVFDVREGGGPPDIYRFWLASGEVQRLTDHPGMDGHPSFSPAGDRIVFTSTRGGNLDIWVMDVDGGNPTRLTDHPEEDWHPRWSPDGSRILFTSGRGGDADLWVMSADGREPRQLTSMPGVEDRGFWSPDGTRIVFQSGGDLWLVDADGGEPERLTHFPGSEGNPAWSPDGRLIAFASDRGGNPDLWELVVEEGEHLRHPRE